MGLSQYIGNDSSDSGLPFIVVQAATCLYTGLDPKVEKNGRVNPILSTQIINCLPLDHENSSTKDIAINIMVNPRNLIVKEIHNIIILGTSQYNDETEITFFST